MRADKRMIRAVKTFQQRSRVYKGTYRRHGHIMAAFFPKGVKLVTVEDHNRFGVLTMMIGKLTRYCANFENGGHLDSVHDLGVYSFIQEELDAAAAQLNKKRRKA